MIAIVWFFVIILWIALSVAIVWIKTLYTLIKAFKFKLKLNNIFFKYFIQVLDYQMNMKDSHLDQVGQLHNYYLVDIHLNSQLVLVEKHLAAGMHQVLLRKPDTLLGNLDKFIININKLYPEMLENRKPVFLYLDKVP